MPTFRNNEEKFNGTTPEFVIRNGELWLYGLHIGGQYFEEGNVYDKNDKSSEAIQEREVNAFLAHFWDTNFEELTEYASNIGVFNNIGVDFGDDYKHELRTGEVA